MTRGAVPLSKAVLKLQVAVLAVGTLFSWFTLFIDYRRFFAAGGRMFEVSGCAVANPLVTPCFYGACAFLVALVWAITVLRSGTDLIARRERGLFWLLAAGAVFAWGNFAYEVYRFLQPQAPTLAFSCPKDAVVAHPLTTPCFYGAMIFLAALVVSVFVLRIHAARR